jgi:phage head maturation protease
MTDGAALAEKVDNCQLPALPRDWRPPKFLLRGMRLTSAGGPVIVAAQRASEMAQDGCEALGGPLPSPKAEKPASEAPSPAGCRPQLQFATGNAASDPDREAVIAELARLSAMYAEAAAESERLAKVVADAKEGRGTGGLALTISLRKLMAKYGLRTENPPPLPLLEPIDAPSIRIRGYAATGDVDGDRHRFSPQSWGRLDPSKVRLLLKHDPNIIAGTVDTLELDAFGRLAVTCTVTHPLAQRMPAFSVGASIGKFTLRNPDSPTLFVGEIEQATLDEISLTECPGNPKAIVLERSIPTAADLSHEAMMAQFKRVRELIVAMSKAA